MSTILKRLVLPFFAASIIFLWVPLYSIYLSLIDINFSVKGFFFFSLLVTFVAGLVFSFLVILLDKVKLRWLASGIMYFAIFWVSISGFLLPLVGRAGMESAVDLQINDVNLILVFFASTVLTLLTYTKLKPATQVFILILVGTSIASASASLYQSGSLFDRLSSVSAHDNVIVLSLDGLAGVVAKQVLEEHPELKEDFKDFIFYDNAVALSPATSASIRSELYGNIDFRGLSLISDELRFKLSDRSNSIRREQRASSDVMTYGAYSSFNDRLSDMSFPGTLIENDYKEISSTALNFYPHIAARIFTPLGAKWLDPELRELQRTYLQSAKSDRVLMHKGAAWDAQNTLQSNELIALTENLHVSGDKRTVRYLHFLHTHFPVDFDEKCQYRSGDAEWFANNQNLKGLLNETECALRQTARYLDKLKSLGVYDKTLFVVKSDHGAPANYFDDSPEGIVFNNHPVWGYNRYRPLLMIKPPVSTNAPMIYSDELASLSDLARTLCLHSPGKPACDEYAGLDLLNPSVEDTGSQLYLDVVRDQKSSYEYDTQITVNVPRQKDFMAALKGTGQVTMKEAQMPLYLQRKRDLNQIRNALEKYHADTGTYPVSKGYDGLFTQWGSAAHEWIRGLAPRYIEALPRDPELSEEATPQYLYRSDGAGYKIVSHGANASTAIASRLDPEMVDPQRKSFAFGYWTENASGW
jgi:hypothetical protein